MVSRTPLFPSEYFQVVKNSLATYKKDDCVTYIKDGISQVEMMMKHMIGQRGLNRNFELCDPIEKSVENPLDVSNFFEALADNFAGVVQYNKDNRGEKKILNIDDVCDVMSNKTIGPPVTRLAQVNHLMLKQEDQKCLDYKYQKMIDQMKNISWKAESSNGREFFLIV